MNGLTANYYKPQCSVMVLLISLHCLVAEGNEMYLLLITFNCLVALFSDVAGTCYQVGPIAGLKEQRNSTVNHEYHAEHFD